MQRSTTEPPPPVPEFLHYYNLFQICGKTLSDKYKLSNHMKVHSDKRHFKCDLCSSEFKGRENLRKHLKKYHGGRDSNPDSVAKASNESGTQVESVDPEVVVESGDLQAVPKPRTAAESKTLPFEDL